MMSPVRLFILASDANELPFQNIDKGIPTSEEKVTPSTYEPDTAKDHKEAEGRRDERHMHAMVV